LTSPRFLGGAGWLLVGLLCLHLEVHVADNSGMIKLAVVAAAAYYAYTQGWLSALGIGAPAAAAPATPAPAVPVLVVPNPNAITGANTVAGVQARTIVAANAPADGLSVDGWGYSLNSVLSPLGMVAPDPMPLFSAAVPGFDRSQVLTAGQYWAVMAPALKSQLGLSGLGLYSWTVQ
jgi:hypothetical protein